jgi:hypothetical protein
MSSISSQSSPEKSEYIGSAVGGLATRLSTQVWGRMVRSLMQLAQLTMFPTPMELHEVHSRLFGIVSNLFFYAQ